MLATSSYTWLLLLTICYWHCMALKENGKKQVPAHSSHSAEVTSHSEEGPSHSEEVSSNSEEGPSYSEEVSSNSKEHSSHSNEISSLEDKAPTCTDRKKNQGETDIDCGGKKCAKCADGKRCRLNRDCISGSCKGKNCAQQSTKPTKPAETTTTITTTPEPTTTTSEPTTTTETTTETTTTTTEMTTTTETTTTTPQPTTTTLEPTTTTETTTTAETTTAETTTTETITTPEPTATIPICEPECKNDGICTGNNVCTCTTGFSGPSCEVQSVGLCLNNETFDTEPILLITFGNGPPQYSTATPDDFDFNTTYKQRFEPVTDDGMFSFINSVHNDFSGAWHTGAMDHTGNDGGYMYLVNADITPGQFYNGRVDNLCIGLRYEFSVYLANLCKPSGKINPNVLFEVRSTDENVLLAQLNSGNIVEQETLTWEKYGFSFIAPSSSVNLLMISNAPGGMGNDIVIDDIALRVCAHEGSGFCPSN